MGEAGGRIWTEPQTTNSVTRESYKHYPRHPRFPASARHYGVASRHPRFPASARHYGVASLLTLPYRQSSLIVGVGWSCRIWEFRMTQNCTAPFLGDFLYRFQMF